MTTDARGPGAGALQPEGEALRRALRWLDDRARADPGLDRARAISEAAARFDLNPLEEDFLARAWKKG